jgi:hypothetical protein
MGQKLDDEGRPEDHRHVLLVGGKYRRTLEPGHHLTPPFISREFCLDGHYPLPIPTAEVIDGDDRLVLGTTVDWQITDVESAFAEADDPRGAIHDAALELRREILLDVGIDDLRRNLAEVESRLERELAVEAGRWGVAIEGVNLELKEDGAEALETIRLGSASRADEEVSTG